MLKSSKLLMEIVSQNERVYMLQNHLENHLASNTTHITVYLLEILFFYLLQGYSRFNISISLISLFPETQFSDILFHFLYININGPGIVPIFCNELSVVQGFSLRNFLKIKNMLYFLCIHVTVIASKLWPLKLVNKT
jgi:hypothetical protein